MTDLIAIADSKTALTLRLAAIVSIHINAEHESVNIVDATGAQYHFNRTEMIPQSGTLIQRWMWHCAGPIDCNEADSAGVVAIIEQRISEIEGVMVRTVGWDTEADS